MYNAYSWAGTAVVLRASKGAAKTSTSPGLMMTKVKPYLIAQIDSSELVSITTRALIELSEALVSTTAL
jgi:hypothetical protein